MAHNKKTWPFYRAHTVRTPRKLLCIMTQYTPSTTTWCSSSATPVARDRAPHEIQLAAWSKKKRKQHNSKTAPTNRKTTDCTFGSHRFPSRVRNLRLHFYVQNCPHPFLNPKLPRTNQTLPSQQDALYITHCTHTSHDVHVSKHVCNRLSLTYGFSM